MPLNNIQELEKLVNSELTSKIKKSEKRIGIFLPNSAGFIVSFFSCQILGKTAIPLNYALSPKEVKDVINDAQIKTLLTFKAPEGRATKIFGNTLDYLQKERDDLKILKLNKPKTQKEIQKSSFLKNLPFFLLFLKIQNQLV